jgi:hypothetical protein
MKGEDRNVCEASCKVSYHLTCYSEAYTIAKIPYQTKHRKYFVCAW